MIQLNMNAGKRSSIEGIVARYFRGGGGGPGEKQNVFSNKCVFWIYLSLTTSMSLNCSKAITKSQKHAQ